MPGPVLLRTEALTRSFGSLIAVNRVDFTVYTGELRSIIGPNGAGKTTLFRLISGEMKPSAGRIWFQDKEITGRPQHMVVRLGVAKSYQITNIFPFIDLEFNFNADGTPKGAYVESQDGSFTVTDRKSVV